MDLRGFSDLYRYLLSHATMMATGVSASFAKRGDLWTTQRMLILSCSPFPYYTLPYPGTPPRSIHALRATNMVYYPKGFDV